MRIVRLGRIARARVDACARRRLKLAFAAALTLGLAAALSPTLAGAEGINYVAMGDSYTAGPGISPASPTAPADRAQSAANYPHLVASALNLSLTDVSCSGAATKNFTTAQFSDQPPQFDALSAATEVVTVSMGGNDHNLFSTLLSGCTALDYGAPNQGAPCRKQYKAFVQKTYEEDQGPQETALAEIHELAPNAKVFVLGYPEITPKDGYCPSAMPWTSGDLKWFRNGVQRRGNAAIKRDAKAHGAIFVDTFKPSTGHNTCEPVGVRWIEPIFGSLTGVQVHPNATGQQQDAYDVEEAMLRAGVR